MKQDLISVIIPVYKVEKYLSKCIDSIINQTYKNLEIILVDDGSPDNCPTICDEYAKKDSRIKVIHKENAGVSSARNVALDVAKGEYIGFVDSDDYIDERMYETLHKYLINFNADISIIGFEEVNENAEKSAINEEVIIKIIENKSKMQECLYQKDIDNYMWNKLYKKETFSNEIRFPLGKAVQDVGTLYRVLDNANKTIISNEKLYYYVQRGSSTVHNINPKLHNDAFEMFAQKYEFLVQKYPEINAMYSRILEVILRGYPFFTETNVKKANKIFKTVGKLKYLKNLSIGIKIRCLMFMMSKKIYKKFFQIRGK